jgi:type II secretory ATPase GspE/PulE/Tfp pilus assembly ATPase PilB-like protein
MTTEGAAPVTLASQDDIARLEPAFMRPLSADFDMSALAGRICPVALQDGSVAIFSLAQYASGDAVDEVERQLVRRGHRLARPARYILPAPLLLSVARGLGGGPAADRRPAVLSERGRSALAAAFRDLVAWGLRHGASDIHFNVRARQAESEVRYTVGGRYIAPERFRGMPTSTLSDLLAVAWMDVRGGNGAVFDPQVEQQGRIRMELDGVPLMLRWASLATDAGPSVCLRVLRAGEATRVASLRELGYPDAQAELLERASHAEGGAIVLAGVVGSGKSTTIAALMRALPDWRKAITLEDPVEFIIENALQNTVGRTLDDDAGHTFDAKLKTIKRSAMNDLLIGEIRDAETGRAFMDLAGSGISLYTTTHAGSAAMIPERLASDFICVSRDFLATPGVLKLLVYQALLPKLCARCAVPWSTCHGKWHAPGGAGAARYAAWARILPTRHGLDPAGLRIRNPAGCSACDQPELPQLRGFSGRTVVAEMIEPAADHVVLECIRNHDNLRLVRHLRGQRTAALKDASMRHWGAMDCAVAKAVAGLIDPCDVEARFGALAECAHD